MFTFRMHGTAGQGVETAARILGKAGVSSGLEAQVIAMHGMERRGSQVTAYVKMDKMPVLSKDLVDEPDFILVFDKSLNQEALRGLKKGSVIIFNAERTNVAAVKNARAKAYFVNATDVALNQIKKPIPNMVMLGALLKYFSKVSLKSVRSALEEINLPKENASALDEGYRNVK